MKYIRSGIRGLEWRIDELDRIVGARKGATVLSIVEIIENPRLHHLYHDVIRRQNELIKTFVG